MAKSFTGGRKRKKKKPLSIITLKPPCIILTGRPHNTFNDMTKVSVCLPGSAT